LVLHGTGGGNGFITSTEAFYVALRAIESGYGVLGTEAEEAVAGDLDGDLRERWDAALSPANLDLANLDALIASLRSAGTIGPTTPLFALGMSNGGAMAISLGAVGSSAVATLFPELRFRSVVSHCASGRANAIAVTTTPTGFLLCANDDNANVDNADAIASAGVLTARGVPNLLDLHPASPLYDARFVREPGIVLSTSQALANELRTAGFVDASNTFVTATDVIEAAVNANPALWPTFVAQTASTRNAVINQMRAMQAEHQMFSDWAARGVTFFDAHNP
jgi:hypothetical protein